MKKVAMLLALGVAAMCAPAHAQVMTYDVSKVTCADYTAMSPDMSQDFSAWMSGWFKQQASDPTINVEGFRKNVASVQSWCASNPKANLMAGLEAGISRAKAGTPGPADIDTSQITCGQFLTSSDDVQTLVASWMGGWFMSTKNLTVIDPRYVRRNAKKVGEFCKKHKKDKLVTVLEKNWK